MNKMSSTSVLVQMTSSPLFFLRQIYTSKLFGNPLRFRDFPSRDSYFARIFQLKKFEESARFEPGLPGRRARATSRPRRPLTIPSKFMAEKNRKS